MTPSTTNSVPRTRNTARTRRERPAGDGARAARARASSATGDGESCVEHLRGNIWESRTRLPNRIARVLFAVTGDELILLHGFIKQTRNAPSEDIALAEARWKEWHDAEGQ